MSKKRILLLVFSCLVLAVGLGAWITWNKPHKKAEDEKGIPVNAVALYSEFSTAEQQANGRYLNKVLEVTGTVSEISKNQDGKTVVLLQAEDPMGGVQCTMRDNAVSVATGSQVTIKGFCNGYTLVVLLSDCILKP